MTSTVPHSGGVLQANTILHATSSQMKSQNDLVTVQTRFGIDTRGGTTGGQRTLAPHSEDRVPLGSWARSVTLGLGSLL